MNRRIPIEIHFVAVMALVVVAVACQWNNRLYHSSRSCNREWSRDSVLVYDLPAIEDESLPLRCGIELRYDKRYPYRKIWLKVEHNLTDTTECEADTIGVELYDESGNPLGKGMAGIYQLSFPFMNFQAQGEYKRRMSITHCMSDEGLVGISDVGVCITRQ